jgi:hypothetical protein
MSLRGVLRGFGLKVGRTTPRTFAARIHELVAGHPTLSTIDWSLVISACHPLRSRKGELVRR